jgi:hypothetical protein
MRCAAHGHVAVAVVSVRLVLYGVLARLPPLAPPRSDAKIHRSNAFRSSGPSIRACCAAITRRKATYSGSHFSRLGVGQQSRPHAVLTVGTPQRKSPGGRSAAHLQKGDIPPTRLLSCLLVAGRCTLLWPRTAAGSVRSGALRATSHPHVAANSQCVRLADLAAAGHVATYQCYNLRRATSRTHCH